MRAYKMKNQSELDKRKSFLVPGDLPDLPAPDNRRATRCHNVWLCRVAVCFLLISLALIMRSAWASSGVASP